MDKKHPAFLFLVIIGIFLQFGLRVSEVIDSIDIFVALKEKNVSAITNWALANNSFNLLDEDGSTPLIISCVESDERLVSLLLRNGADPNFPNSAGWTALAFAALKGNVEAANTLLRYHADILFEISPGITAYSIAQKENQTKVIELFESTIKSIHDNTANREFREAVLHGDETSVDKYIAEGADVNERDENGWPALMVAANVGNPKLISKLVGIRFIHLLKNCW